VRYACRINGIDRLALTKPDVLGDLAEVSLCTGYRLGREVLRDFPNEPWLLEKVTPVLRTYRGWGNTLRDTRTPDDFPAAFKDYLRAIEDLAETRVAVVSTGVERRETVLVEPELAGLVDVAKVRSGLAA
ncbi:MAG: adenylosuccinate synthetase, partial [Candidatus Aminicenantes bacterium]|nr:adenylosuccinate synthetase [Candidatus Aminicenantes bacterium]